MITRFANLTSRWAAALTMMLAIAACGGGGGGGGGSFLGDGGGGSDTDTYFIDVQLLDGDGNPTSSVNPGSPGTVQAVVRKNSKNGAPVADVIVDINTGSNGLLSPATASKLTNSEGAVTLRVEAGTGKGADTIVASVQDQAGATVEGSVNYQVGIENLRLGRIVGGLFFEGEIDITPEGQIPSDGTAILEMAIVDQDDQLVGSAESVKISSTCIDSGQATVSENPATTENGSLSVTYSPNGCEGVDAITAEVVGSGAQAFGNVGVAAPGGSGIGFVGAEPALIVLKGTGGGPNRQENSTVTFKTTDSKNNPVKGVEVRFELSTDVGGLSINPSSAVSDANGLVQTVVSSGDVATVVRIIATANASDGSGEISVVSDVLTVTTGLPDQDSIDVSVGGDFVVEDAMSQSGLTRDITVRMADKFNNPVPDGTAAVFTTEYGAIGGSCNTVGGSCTVTWTSQNPRFPLLTSNQALVKTINDSDYSCSAHSGRSGPCPADLGSIRGGRSTILVHAIGEESFVDRNGNGIFDQAEAEAGLFANLTEAFIDYNEDGDGPNLSNPHLHDPVAQRCLDNPNSLVCRSGAEESFVDYNSNGVFDANGDSPDNGYPDEGVEAVFNGLLCPPEGDGIWCSRELVHVRASTVVIMGGGPPYYIALYRGRTPASSTTYGNTYQVYVSDIYNNRPPAGTTVNITASGACGVTTLTDPTIANTSGPGAFAVSFTQTGEENEDTERTENEITIAYGGAELTVPCTPLTPTYPPDPNDLVFGPG